MDKLKHIKIIATAFIVPNHATNLNLFFDEPKSYLKEFASLNKIQLSDDDKIAELWLINPDYNNLARHGAEVTIGEHFYDLDLNNLEYIPVKMLEDVKEGDVINYQAPIDARIDHAHQLTQVILDMEVTCQQGGYRYQSFGSFEEVLRIVTTEPVGLPVVELNDTSQISSDSEPKRFPTLDIIEGESVSSKNINDKGVIEMTENIKVTANAFVIPNEAIAMGQQHVGVREYLKEFAKLNNIEIADSDKIISIWLTNPQSENLARYGFNVTVNDGILELSPYDLEYFPAKLLEGIKEGDTVKYLSPTKAFYNGNKGRDHIDVVLDVTITCQQKGYRFEASGNFEDAVVKVLNVCEPAKKEITVVTDIKKEKEEEKEEKVGIKMKISKTWNNLPNAAKTTIKVVGGTIAVAAVGFGAKVLYDHYNSDDEVAATSESKDIDVIDVEDDDAISITADDCEITVTTGDEI